MLGMTSFISLANCASLLLGSRDVVTSTCAQFKLSRHTRLAQVTRGSQEEPAASLTQRTAFSDNCASLLLGSRDVVTSSCTQDKPQLELRGIKPGFCDLWLNAWHTRRAQYMSGTRSFISSANCASLLLGVSQRRHQHLHTLERLRTPESSLSWSAAGLLQ